MAIGDFFKRKKLHTEDATQEVSVREEAIQESSVQDDAIQDVASPKQKTTADRLAYKTRGNASPQGKQRVYFCCHPKDHKRYFNQISDQILKKQNCAIWYDTAPQTGCDEAFLENLSQMQLFVIPVTSAFLTAPNKALDVEFAYAMEHHIPVLPLLQEAKIVNLFNKKCGDLQFLYARESDLTAINFDEKLDRFLQTVLVGDELAEKIRQAFDAYIFMSYRKQDRKYAQELMGLIHNQPFCRDIAIWYDEFLVPGEDFSDSIRDAIKKSDLFVMTVTPNLLNKPNYVMTTEYPLACQEQKPVIAVEMVETDREEFEKCYVNQDVLVPFDVQGELSAELDKAIKNLAIQETSEDPQHSFFIGLAYLGGIDVEVNYERAAALIQHAADAGLSEAVKKLVSMYQNGEGVKRDYELALQMQKRLTDLLRKEFEKQGAKAVVSGSGYLYECCQLGAMLFQMHRKEDAKRVYAETLLVAETMREESDTWNIKTYIAECHRQLGNLYRYEESFADAKKHCEAFYELCKQMLQTREGTKEDLSVEKVCLVASMGNLAELARDEEDLDLALDWYEQSLVILEELSKETDYILVRRNQATIHNNIGEMLDSYGDLFAGREHYMASNKILEKLLKESDQIDIKIGYQIGMDNLASSYLAEGDCRNAEKYAQKSLKLAKELVAETESLEAKINLGISYNGLAKIYSFAGNKEKAMDCVSEIVNINNEIEPFLK